jgi:hypothetical protein
MKALTLFEIIIIILFEVNFILKYKNKTIKLKKKRPRAQVGFQLLMTGKSSFGFFIYKTQILIFFI